MKGDGILYYMYTVQHLLGEVVHIIEYMKGGAIVLYSTVIRVR